MATTAINALMPSSRDHGTRPLFIEAAAASQYSQNAAHPTAKIHSTALIVTHTATKLKIVTPHGDHQPAVRATQALPLSGGGSFLR
jgi:hypothetical protein